MDVWFGFSKSPKASLLNAIKTLQKSIDINESFGHAHALLGHIYSLMRQYEKAILEGEKAVELAPNSNSCLVWLAASLRYIGKSDEAIPLIQMVGADLLPVGSELLVALLRRTQDEAPLRQLLEVLVFSN